jgi:hypothetical protein
MTPLPLFSISTSDWRTSSSTSARPLGVFTSTPMLFLLRLEDAKFGFMYEFMIVRMKSGAFAVSTFRTSAPSSA